VANCDRVPVFTAICQQSEQRCRHPCLRLVESAEKVAAGWGAERANRGILITTSYFGKDAYDFAKDKNLTLLDGSELLGLLEKHGYKFRIDLKEARTRMGLSHRE